MYSSKLRSFRRDVVKTFRTARHTFPELGVMRQDEILYIRPIRAVIAIA